jgi:hypothetical protein
MVGVLRAAGFDIAMVARAFALVDSVIYGHALQIASMPFDAESAPEAAAALASDPLAGAYPNLAAMAALAASGPGAVPMDVEFGLDLVLDGLERARTGAG